MHKAPFQRPKTNQYHISDNQKSISELLDIGMDKYLTPWWCRCDSQTNCSPVSPEQNMVVAAVQLHNETAKAGKTLCLSEYRGLGVSKNIF